ncbi:pilin N-terminal domain-containing protein [Anaerococcus murdochii]|uniref:pilin N-terminal domain-containing protein n=1 Tax=Anaerococcus murdochii TaxID=411577 RepID=UPI0032B3ED39
MKKKILSLLTAFAMVFGILVAPFTTAKAADEKVDPNNNANITKTESVTLHKLLMDKDTLSAWNSSEVEKGGYNGTQDLTALKALEVLRGKTFDEADGVYFAWQKQFPDYKKNKEGELVDKQGIVIQAGAKTFDSLNSEENKKKAVPIKEWRYIDNKGVEASVQNPSAEGFKNAVFGGTTADKKGHKFVTSNLPQDKATEYRIVEIHELSSYKGANGETLTGMKAVPVKITLPLINDKGGVKDAHVYPKNTEEKPKIDKNFDKEKNGDVNGIETKDLINNQNNDKDVEIKTDADKYQREKGIINRKIGDKVPYKVVTEIPAQTKWALAKWDDHMTNGLTYNKDLSIELKIGQKTIDLVAPKQKDGKSTIDNVTEDQPESDYTITETDSGFVLKFTKTGLEKLNNKEAQTITLKYTATINKDAQVDVEDKNDVKFKYGNKPSKETEPVPTKPDTNGNLKVVKSWDDGVWKEGESATFELRDAKTGRVITADDLKQGNATKEDFEAYKKSFRAVVTIGYETNDGTNKQEKDHTWKYLDPSRQYIAVETASTPNSDAAYTENQPDGTIKVVNHKSENPSELNPSEPKVVTYGKRFVKADANTNERLQGAEFVIKNANGEFLAIKDLDTTKGEGKDLADAKKAYDDAIDAWNTAVKQNPDKGDEEIAITIGTKQVKGKTAVKAEIEKLQNTYEEKFKIANNAYEWVKDQKAANVIKLVSDKQGKFEIKGIQAGTYNLVEIKAPTGYATRGDEEFTVGAGTYAKHEQGVKYESDEKVETGKDNEAQRVDNKKVTIPQTGGIGSLIFIVAGAAIMIGAFVAYKKSQAVEA